ncbi:hypothetical protein F5B19DRAFT_443600 [Rostrohypoxylon terebratum]|nr:hypothetical protein F5B19DRAFT_443600 [Rostrohypoxylon terebratum]
MWTSTSALGGRCERELNPFLEWEPASDPSPNAGGSPTGPESHHLQAWCAAVRCGNMAVNRHRSWNRKNAACPCRSGMVSPCLDPRNAFESGNWCAAVDSCSLAFISEPVPTDQPEGGMLTSRLICVWVCKIHSHDTPRLGKKKGLERRRGIFPELFTVDPLFNLGITCILDELMVLNIVLVRNPIGFRHPSSLEKRICRDHH